MADLADKQPDEFIEILNLMADILTQSQHSNFWETKLRSLAGKTTLQIDDLKAQIRQMYGGIGSINDLYVQLPNGEFDTDGTERFSTLRTELYQLATSSLAATLSQELSDAITNNNTNLVAELISGDVDLNRACNHLGWSPLHVAIEHGYSDIIKALLVAGADINIQDKSGFTPLHLAVDVEADGAIQNDETPVPEFSLILLNQGADITIPDKDGKSTVELAVQYQYAAFLEELKSRGLLQN